MAKKNTKSTNMGKTKRSTDSIIDGAIARQNTWMEQRRTFASRFFHSLNVFAKPNPARANAATVVAASNPTPSASEKKNRSVWRAYWFPIVCALAVIFIAIWVYPHQCPDRCRRAVRARTRGATRRPRSFHPHIRHCPHRPKRRRCCGGPLVGASKYFGRDQWQNCCNRTHGFAG